jgi:exopolysaccharide biosynthesis polyprenyl glycosylphosphotransferase
MTVMSERLARTASAPMVRSARVLPFAALLLDLALVTLSGSVALYGRERTHLFNDQAEIGSTLGIAGPLMVLGWVLVIYLVGGYAADSFGGGAEEFKRVAHASLYAAALVGIGSYLTKFQLSRGYFVLLFAVGLPALLLGRLALRQAVHAARRRGVLQQRVLISGSPSHVDDIARILRRQPWLGYQVVGALTPAVFVQEETPGGVPVVGNVDDVALAVSQNVDTVFFAGGSHTSASQMRQAVWELEPHSVQVVVAPSVNEISSERMSLRPVGGLPLLHIDPPTWRDASRLGKRSFDVVGALLLLLLFSPLLVGAALGVKLHDGGPVFFRQRRIGQDGEPFDCFKFRSMVIDAEDRLAALREDVGFKGGLFKMREDPRITRPGKWLRRFSVDELPQLVNVVRGEMSLVGPRPPLPTEVHGYDEEVARRLRVRPGMTGLWQVSGRSDLSFDEAIRLDLYYVDNWSMIQDLTILARTLGAVLGSRGAY